MPLKIALADDDELFRNILRKKIAAYPSFNIILEAGDGDELLAKLDSSNADIVILDYNMPKLNGVRVAEVIRKKYPYIKPVILTSTKITEYHDELRKKYLCECYFKESLEQLIICLKKEIDLLKGKTTPTVNITHIEQEILRLLSKGNKNHQIGVLLNRSSRTIEGDRKQLSIKLGIVNSTYSLTNFAKNFGYDL